jgi:hypothetical protein
MAHAHCSTWYCFLSPLCSGAYAVLRRGTCAGASKWRSSPILAWGGNFAWTRLASAVIRICPASLACSSRTTPGTACADARPYFQDVFADPRGEHEGRRGRPGTRSTRRSHGLRGPRTGRRGFGSEYADSRFAYPSEIRIDVGQSTRFELVISTSRLRKRLGSLSPSLKRPSAPTPEGQLAEVVLSTSRPPFSAPH